MKKTIIAIFALAALASCQSLIEEWQPVFSIDPDEPAWFVPYTEETLPDFSGTFTTIKDLKAMYKNGKPMEITGNVWIKGQVTSSDKTGNIYRELYIQDKTGGIDLKLGKSSLYSEYSLGQWVYVHCDGLTLGAYNGMPQLGLEADQTTTNDYETSYIDVQVIIDQHVFRGAFDKPVKPAVVTEADVKASLSAGFKGDLWGKLVTIKGLKYGNEIFALFYPNSNLPHTSANPENRVFLSDKGTWGINTWACSKAKYIEYLQKGAWDAAEVGSGATRYGSIKGKPSEYLKPGKTLDSFGADADLTYKEIMIKYANGNYVSHYFKLGSTDIQVRTSGFARFADIQLDPAILNGATVDITGILTIYSGSAQFSLIDDPSVSVVVH
ncbi:MAG: OB-fold nucleic acid binding domain-containing protein [Bacteroidales bacterium]|nr:OB-fold nucleic acid binding domain-containing protein [Bacteroidales bacterium]